jgi:hypothetical protein
LLTCGQVGSRTNNAAILDWTEAKDLPREQLRDLLIAAFGAALLAAQQIDPEIRLTLSG